MEFLQAILIAIVEGLTEFIPTVHGPSRHSTFIISSSTGVRALRSGFAVSCFLAIAALPFWFASTVLIVTKILVTVQLNP
jgi:undecaprenyl pyrophosphate phosphatase UppP